MAATGFELLEPEVRRDPYEIYAHGRRNTPVQRLGSLDVFLIYRHADVQAILRDTDLWASPETTLRPIEDAGEVAASGPQASDRGRMRRLLHQVFAPRVMPRLIAEREPHLRELVEQLLDRALIRGEVDAVAALAAPLPVIVIAEILGVPAEDRDQFRAWSNAITSAPTSDLFGRTIEAHQREHGEAGRREMYDYFAQMVEARRREPREDLVSAIAHAEVDGEAVTHDEILEILVLLLIAGNENTASLVGNAIVQLLRHPDALAEVRRDNRLLPGAIEEVLRFDSPFPFDPRQATRSIQLHGVRIERGQTVACLLGSANRDETVFEHADQFDIRRSPNRHVAFGFGPHFCLGANLARLEARIALEAILRRARSIQFASADPLPLNASPYLRGFGSIPLLIEAN